MLPQQLPDLEFNPASRFAPATRELFELPVSGLRRAGRMVQALAVTTTEIIDVSKWQLNTAIDYAALRAGGVAGIIAKASEGTSIIDNQFLLHCEGALDAGMYVMPYHFFRSNLQGVAQAEHFMTTVMPLIDSLGYVPPLWVDVETADGTNNTNRLSRLQSCMSQLMMFTSANKPGLYTSPGFANTSLTPTPGWVNSYHHWIAHWTSASLPTSPTGWDVSKRAMWQYGVWNDHAWCGPVPGCSPDIDRDRFFGDELALAEFIGAPEPLTLDQRVSLLEAEARVHGWDV